MNHADAQILLEDYFDGTLPPEVHREIEAHLAACAGCREELSSLGALLDTVAGLRERRIEPARDLWPGIADQIRSKPARSSGWSFVSVGRRAGGAGASNRGGAACRETRRRIPWPWLAGAAGLAAAAVVVLLVAPRSDPMSRELSRLDAQVQESRQQVRLPDPARVAEGTVSASSWRAFDDGLGVLDQAIKDSRAALARDPGNPILQKSLLAAYQRQLELIRWAQRVVRQS